MTESQREAPVNDREAAGALWGAQALRSTLTFLAGPAVLMAIVSVFGVRLSGVVLYGTAAVFGAALVIRTLRDPEWLLAVATLYLPLNMMFVVPIAPGVNGTNVVELLLLFAWFRCGRRKYSSPVPTASLMRAYMVVTLLSVATASVTMGLDFVLDHVLDIKAWFDQFIVFFVFLRLIRDARMARRLVIYLMLGAVVVLAFGFQEWLEKRDASTIEKSRLLGPQLQPNDFGAFLACTSAFFLAQLLTHLGRWRVWAASVPYFVALARVLLSTFSRGAYVAVALAGVVAGYVRGKAFLACMAVLGLVLLIAMPQLVPESLRDRMAQTSTQSSDDQLDNSSETRLILWRAALRMTAESPVFGWGFKSFPKLKRRYTEVEVQESDNHNMYLYLCSQMGIPAAVLLVLIFWRMYSLGVRMYRHGRDSPDRSIGMAAAAMAAAEVAVNMFGSRMVDICVTAPFWVMLAVVVRLSLETEEQQRSKSVKREA